MGIDLAGLRALMPLRSYDPEAFDSQVPTLLETGSMY